MTPEELKTARELAAHDGFSAPTVSTVALRASHRKLLAYVDELTEQRSRDACDHLTTMNEVIELGEENRGLREELTRDSEKIAELTELAEPMLRLNRGLVILNNPPARLSVRRDHGLQGVPHVIVELVRTGESESVMGSMFVALTDEMP